MFNRLRKIGIVTLFAALFLVACSGNETTKEDTSGKLQVVATFSILHDIATQVGGEHVDVHSMVPIGTAPHEYEPLPEDVKKATNADLLFYNGLNLEGEEDGWFFKLVESANVDQNKVFELMEGVEPLYLSSADGSEKEVNPHAFLDPVVGIQMTENARDAFIKIDEGNKADYEANAEKLLEELHALDEEYATKIGEIPEEQRILVTSERAFQYMAQRYGLKEGYLWEVDTDENGTPAQIKALVNFIEENNVSALFVETNVDERSMETVANETGAEIVAKVFSDELGEPGEEGGTLVKFLQYNIDTIHAGLTK